MRRISLEDTDLDVEVRGSGEPVVLIQTALVADELMPLAEQLLLRGDYHLILYHRRGYGGSGPVEGPGSITRDAHDCRDLLAALGIEHAHVVGVSYSAAVALQLAVTATSLIHTLTVIEPPPLQVPSADEFVAANAELVQHYRVEGPQSALDSFLHRVMGADWRDDLERHIPGAVRQVERDTGTFFETDIPALLSWNFGAAAARQIDQPTLYIGGSRSGPWFAEVRELMLNWLPRSEDLVVEGADHFVVATHPERVSEAIAAFIARHPIGG